MNLRPTLLWEIVHGSRVGLAIGGMEIEVREAGIGGEDIGHGIGEGGIGFGAECQPRLWRWSLCWRATAGAAGLQRSRSMPGAPAACARS